MINLKMELPNIAHPLTHGTREHHVTHIGLVDHRDPVGNVTPVVLRRYISVECDAEHYGLTHGCSLTVEYDGQQFTGIRVFVDEGVARFKVDY